MCALGQPPPSTSPARPGHRGPSQCARAARASCRCAPSPGPVDVLLLDARLRSELRAAFCAAVWRSSSIATWPAAGREGQRARSGPAPSAQPEPIG